MFCKTSLRFVWRLAIIVFALLGFGRTDSTILTIPLETTMSEEKVVDRRRHKRFRVKTGGLALLSPDWPHSTLVGDILDISPGGIAFQYVGDEPPRQEVCEVGLACSYSHFYLGKIPVKAVSDFSMAKVPFGSLVPRRLSLRFEKLTPDQSSGIQEYIKDHAVSLV
jgi:hypothetical protein